MEVPATLSFFESPTNLLHLALYGIGVMIALLAVQQILRGVLILTVLAGAAAVLGYSWTTLEVDLRRYADLHQLTGQMPQLAPLIQQALSDQQIVRWEYDALRDIAAEWQARLRPPADGGASQAAP